MKFNNYYAEMCFKKLDLRAILPSYKYNKDSGADLCALEDYLIEFGKCTVVETGLAVQIVIKKESIFTFEIQIRPRSGLAINEGITIINSPATIDFLYTGPLKFPITKSTYGSYLIKAGTRCAQAVICPVLTSPLVKIIEVDNFNMTERGDNGFGSTGL